MIGFNIDEYMKEFGDVQGRLLYTEFQSILSRDCSQRSVTSMMRVYVAIWRVLGASWKEHIASASRPKDGCPSDCKKPDFHLVPDMQLIADYAGQINLGKPGRITGGFTHMSQGMSVTFCIGSFPKH